MVYLISTLSKPFPNTAQTLTCHCGRWLRPANMDLCGSLPSNINFTVCQISGSTCIPIAPSNFSSGCGECLAHMLLLPSNINFTVCQISGSTCIPIAPSNFSSGCGEHLVLV